MHSCHVRLESAVSTSFRCQRAADSLDIDTKKKSVYELRVDVDLETPFHVGLIVGASGSGKTTLAQHIFGPDCFDLALDLSRPVIDQLPASWEYDECQAALTGVGLTAVPCWIRPALTLSTGQRARALAALLMAREESTISVVDEWTSVVDRTVAKVMSHCIQKHARRFNRQIILLSCHYDVIEWLNPDWIIDCNTATYHDRRSLCPSFRRAECLDFDVFEIDTSSWPLFSPYHYLSARLPGGRNYPYGLFHGNDQVGFTLWSQYVPPVRGQPQVWHGNRAVIHPDYLGLGLGIQLVNASAAHLAEKHDFRIWGKFSSRSMLRAMTRDPLWVLRHTARQIGRTSYGQKLQRGKQSFRENVNTWSFEYVGPGSLYARGLL